MPGRTCAIAVEGIEVFAYHGVLPEEKERGQRFLIDVRLELAGVPGRDELEDTVDYARVAGDAARLAADTRFDLIETLAGRIADRVMEDPRILHASITVCKPDAPMPVRAAGVRVTVRAGRRADGREEGGV